MAPENSSYPSIPNQEFAERGQRLQHLLADSEYDILLVNGNEAEFANVRYLSDYWPIFESAGVVIPPSGALTLLIGPESETYAADRSRVDRIRMLSAYREAADPEYSDISVTSFAEVFDEAGVSSPRVIGLAGSFATNYIMLEDLRAAFPQAQIRRADSLLTQLRIKKSDAELACLREAFRISEAAVEAILKKVKPGWTELEVVGVAQETMYAEGAEYEGMPQYVLSGPNTRHAISRPTHRRLEPGDVVQLDISARVAGYSSGVGRILTVGPIPARDRELIDFCRDAHEEFVSWMRAGVISGDLARRYRQFFTDRGHGDYFLYGPAAGLGLMEVEAPWMEPTSTYALEETMTFQIDTYALSDTVGARWENGVQVLREGTELFSHKNMEVIDIS
jgi:Xaa-Pro aminopeptidase